MGLRIGIRVNLASRVALISVAVGAFWLGCVEETRVSSPPSDVPIFTTFDAGSGSGGAAPAPDLCGCAVMLDTAECRECGLAAVATTGYCASSEGACKTDSACVADSECVGACIHSDAGDEVACVSKCIAAATDKYVNYLRCTCTHCAPCQSDVTCPAP